MAMEKKATILIIDPCALVQRLLAARLSRLNVTTLCAATAEEGLRAIRSESVDLVLCEVNLPLMSGFELCQTIRSDSKTQDVPVIFLTGVGEPVDKARGFELGAVDFVTKPPDVNELCMRVKAALRTREAIAMLAEQAKLDALTGLHNRRYFDERLAEELSAASRYGRAAALLMIDIDHFKQINDSVGHVGGDDALQRMGQLLRSFFRSSDVVCRFGGEEFAVVLRDATIASAQRIAERLGGTVRSDRTLCDVVGKPVTVSVGVAVTVAGDFEGQAANPSRRLVERADEALYRAKRSGRDRVVCGEVDCPALMVNENVGDAIALNEPEPSA